MHIDYQACWQLPIGQKIDQAEYIRMNAKFHYFVNEESLCGKYYQETKLFDNLIANDQEEEMHNHLCKACLKKKRKLGKP